jgi:hypothetical protein
VALVLWPFVALGRWLFFAFPRLVVVRAHKHDSPQGAKDTGYFRSMLHGPGPAVNKYKKMKQ